jgi:hypothetical protein
VKPRQTKILGVLVATALLGVNFWAWITFESAKSDAIAAVADARACRQLAARITSLKVQPTMAASSQEASEQLAARVQSSVQSLGISADTIASIAPDAPMRLGNSPYFEQATTVDLRGVTLAQLVDLICNLSSGSALHVKSLHLSAVPQQTNGLWDAEVTVCSMIYSPSTNQETKGIQTPS